MGEFSLTLVINLAMILTEYFEQRSVRNIKKILKVPKRETPQNVISIEVKRKSDNKVLTMKIEY